MPKLEPKQIQKELDEGLIRPFYWIYGQEALKVRELFKRIRKAVLGQQVSDTLGPNWNEEVFDGSETDGPTVLDSLQSLSLGGGIKLVVIRDAHLLKSPEKLVEVFGPPQKKTELFSVCVCLSKDLDARKKFSKLLTERAAVIPCDEVTEAQRESWILYLAKRRGITLSSDQTLHLSSIDPWTLDIIDQELEKFSLSDGLTEIFLKDSSGGVVTDSFLHSFFTRDLKGALIQVGSFAEHPDEALPLLGLMNWNVKQLASYLADEEKRTQYFKPNPYLAPRLKQWSKYWKLREVVELQSELFQLDRSFKQTPLLPLGLWSTLVQKFCR